MSAEKSESVLSEPMRREIKELIREVVSEWAAPGDEWLTVGQAMAVANMSEWQVRQLVRRGDVEYYQPNPSKPPLRIKRSSLQSLSTIKLPPLDSEERRTRRA
jgi:hypothetical protein